MSDEATCDHGVALHLRCHVCEVVDRAVTSARDEHETVARLTRQVTERDEWVEFWRRGELAWQEWAAKIAGKPEGGWHGDSTARDIIERRLTIAEGLLRDCERILCDTPKYALSVHDVEVTGPAIRAFLNPPDEAPTSTAPDAISAALPKGGTQVTPNPRTGLETQDNPLTHRLVSTPRSIDSACKNSKPGDSIAANPYPLTCPECRELEAGSKDGS